MERILLFCTISTLVIYLQLITGTKLSLRVGVEDMKQLKNCTMCPRHYKPICASNGRWYHNACFMACEVGDNSGVGILYEGECRPEHMHIHNPNENEPNISITCEQQCPQTKTPVCATDGKWYHNTCYLICNDLMTAPEVECASTLPNTVLKYTNHFHANCTNCTRVYDPVCMDDGNWYYNECVMSCILGPETGATVLYHGKCIHF